MMKHLDARNVVPFEAEPIETASEVCLFVEHEVLLVEPACRFKGLAANEHRRGRNSTDPPRPRTTRDDRTELSKRQSPQQLNGDTHQPPRRSLLGTVETA